MRRLRFGVLTALASAVIAVGALLGAMRDEPALWGIAALAGVAVGLGWVIHGVHPDSAVAPALAWSSAAVVLVAINDVLAASAATSAPLPGASVAAHWWAGAWPVNLAGAFALLLVFPDDSGRSRRFQRIVRALPWSWGTGALLVLVGLWDVPQEDGRVSAEASGSEPAVLVGMALIATSMLLAVIDLLARHRAGSAARRRQIRWLLLAGSGVMVLLIAGWGMQLADLPLAVSFSPFLFAILVLLPLAVTIAVLRHDLFDIDWILGQSIAWLSSFVISAAAFAVLVLGVTELLPSYTTVGITLAAFTAALVLLPAHRALRVGIHRLIDRENVDAVTLATRFAAQVRDGTRPPSAVTDTLRLACRDSGLRVLILEPRASEWMLPDGTPTTPDPHAPYLDIERGAERIARIELSIRTPRLRRRIAELAQPLTLALELCRLDTVLRRAAEDARAVNARLAEATAAERRRLQHDLHDAVQQRLIGIGMLVRAVQSDVSDAAAAGLERIVHELRETTEEIRRIAHGVRPSRLEDGLAAALASLRMTGPIPVDVEVCTLPELSEAQSATVYLIAAEAVTNALKHARPNRVQVRLSHQGDRLTLCVTDDGTGLVTTVPTGLTDRAVAIGGSLRVGPEPGRRGTRVTAEIPCAS
ncbi:histidine kinase [Microbacterium soli]|uniref:histidine kinase n=1 Tax=Microbacterium soli TaxID=446075 RepID=A0ABP7NH41_9MICO